MGQVRESRGRHVFSPLKHPGQDETRGAGEWLRQHLTGQKRKTETQRGEQKDLQHSETDLDGRRESKRNHMHTHTLSLFPSHSLTHSHTAGPAPSHAAALSLAGNNPTLTWGPSCTGGTEAVTLHTCQLQMWKLS